MYKILILGSDGLLGSNLQERFEKDGNFQVITTARKCRADIFFNYSPKSLRKVIRESKPDFIVNCIASTRSDSSLLEMINTNSLLPLNLSLLRLRYKYRFFHIGTNAIFSGKSERNSEETCRLPLKKYGFSKQLGDFSGINGIVLRTSFIGRSPKPEVKSGLIHRIELLPKGAPFAIEDDYFWNGISSKCLSEYIFTAIKFQFLDTGVFHLSSSRIITRVKLVTLLIEYLNRSDLNLILPETREQRNLALESNKSEYTNQIWKLSKYSCVPSVEEFISEV